MTPPGESKYTVGLSAAFLYTPPTVLVILAASDIPPSILVTGFGLSPLDLTDCWAPPGISTHSPPPLSPSAHLNCIHLPSPTI